MAGPIQADNVADLFDKKRITGEFERLLAVRLQLLREDRILHEIHATGGDVRRICDLFGLTISGATRYLNTVEHPDLTTEGDRAH